jgi:hypothetical protein
MRFMGGVDGGETLNENEIYFFDFQTAKII